MSRIRILLLFCSTLLLGCKKVDMDDYKYIIGEYEWYSAINDTGDSHSAADTPNEYSIRITKRSKFQYAQYDATLFNGRIIELSTINNVVMGKAVRSKDTVYFTVENNIISTRHAPYSGYDNFFKK